MQTSFHHQPEAQHPNFPLSTSWQADYPISWHIPSNRCSAVFRSLLERSGHSASRAYRRRVRALITLPPCNRLELLRSCFVQRSLD
jgi:hypothetical protein